AAELDLDGPTPTFLRPNLRAHARAIEAAGVELLEADLADDRFHRAAFGDPNDLRTVLLEARTFAPVEPETGLVPACGRFVELSVATRSLDETTSFWTSLGFSVVAEHDSPPPSPRLEGDGLVLGSHQTGPFRTAFPFAAT